MTKGYQFFTVENQREKSGKIGSEEPETKILISWYYWSCTKTETTS
jgi:hypothetical protein